MLTVRIALRYLASKKSYNAVNIISYVSIAGVAIASAAMIIVMSVFNGFSDFAAGRLSAIDPPLLVEPRAGAAIEGADSLAAGLAALPEIAAATPVVEERAFAVAGDRQMPLTVKAVDPDGFTASSLPAIMLDGEPSLGRSGDLSAAVSSVGVANGLAAYPGLDVVVKIYEPKRLGRLNPAAPARAFCCDSVVVAGVYRVEQAEYDVDMILVPLEVGRRLLGYTDQATSIELSLALGATLSDVRKAVERLLPAGLVAKDRYQQQEQSFRMISIEKWVTMLMLTFILVIASFNILSAMSMLIIEKRPNRAILSAMGATSGMISSIFAWLSFLITAIGGAIGIVLGLGLSLAQQFGGFVKLGASDMSAMAITVYPVRVAPLDLLVIFAVVALIGLITSLIIKSVTRA